MKNTKNILILLLCSLISFPFIARAQEQIYLDNEHIQQYKGQVGKWVMIRSKSALENYSSEFSSSIEDILTINSAAKTKELMNTHVFIPYSESYLKSLHKKGITQGLLTCEDEQFIWPAEGVYRITSVLGLRWGKFHPGIDIPSPRKTPVLASKSGRVIFAGYMDGYGTTIILEHSNKIGRASCRERV